jgi:arsenate reductase
MKTVVCACLHDAGRSQIVAAVFNIRADPMHARALSANTGPAERIHPEVVEAMREVGIGPEGASARTRAANPERGPISG